MNHYPNTDPVTVKDLVLREVTNSSVRVSWTPSLGRYDRYKVTIIPSITVGDDEPITVDDNEVTISGLVSMTTYVVSVVTLYGISESEPADIEVTPGVDKPVTIIDLEGKKKHVFKLKPSTF